MADNEIVIRKEIPDEFLPEEILDHGKIDLQKLSLLARKAMEGSKLSLNDATNIADSNIVSRWWNSGDMQKQIIKSISCLSDLSKVNLGLSAICNDLAAANLRHAQHIDSNQSATDQQLIQIQKSTSELLDYLRKPRDPGLLDRLLPALTKVKLTEHDDVKGWLKQLSENIDLQYLNIEEKIEKITLHSNELSTHIDELSTHIDSINGQITSLTQSINSQATSLNKRIDHSFTAIETYEKNLKQIIVDVETNARLANTELESKLSAITREMTKRHAEVVGALRTEKNTREEMQKALVKFIEKRENEVRKTIAELNRHLLNRMLMIGSGIVIIQALSFGLLAYKIGLFK